MKANRELFVGKRVLELGSGCGVGGLSAAQVAGSTVLSDWGGELDGTQSVCACVCMCVCVHMEVYVCERERESLRVFVCVCVYIEERESVRVCACMRVCAYVCVCRHCFERLGRRA